MTPHEILGVSRSASPEEIRSAYRQLVVELHPDTRTEEIDPLVADEALRRVQDAWRILRQGAQDDGMSWDDDESGWDGPVDEIHHRGRRFPWWMIAVAILVVIFVFTAYAGSVPAGP